MSLDLQHTEEQGKTVLHLKGRLDGQNWETFTQQAAKLIPEEPGTVILNFADVPYISSAGLRGILIIAKDVRRRKGVVAISSAVPMVQEVMDLARLSLVVPIHKTLEDALSAS